MRQLTISCHGKQSKTHCEVEEKKSKLANGMFKIQFLFKTHSENEGVLREEREFWKNMYQKNHWLPLRDSVTRLVICMYQ